MEEKSDFLIIGSGVAGLTFALEAAKVGSVAVVTKKGMMDTNTSLAQGGIASVFGNTDSYDLHIEDTLEAGDGLCNEAVVEMVVKNGPDRIRELIDMGVKFELQDSADREQQQQSPSLDLGREGGHSQKRIVHALDMTGMEVEKALVAQVESNENIKIFEDHIAIDLISFSTRMKKGLMQSAQDVFCCGAYILDTESSHVKTFGAKVILLATGGTGKVYLYTSNPDVATGDGIAMAYRAGASVSNLEFVQFHPTCLYHPDAKNFLISEAVRGEGGILKDFNGTPFMEKYHPQKDLACRDIVARAIDTELKKSGHEHVFLDISHKDSEFVKKRFPTLYKKCLSFSIDMTTDPIPVVPAAHYMCGGVMTDTFGRTDIHRLYAIGETACTGLHGANRLASNSLLEALVYARRAARQAISEIKTSNAISMPEISKWDETGTTDSDELIMVSHNWDEIRRLMWNYVGIVRSDKRLARAQRRIDIIQNEIKEYYWNFKVESDLVELRNIATVAELIIRSAMYRKESRGLHYTIEYPDKDDIRWLKDTIVRREFMG
ncbi:L-aspartate oxidase [Desulfobacterales bacterium HSG16]|nr:L-aspartate oxidase [Desulfobacterales bacterium HSG16]